VLDGAEIDAIVTGAVSGTPAGAPA